MTGFVLQAATRAAEVVLAVEREPLVPAAFFDELLAALDAPDKVPDGLVALARQPRSFVRG